jgi:hypothetical protein
MSDYVVPASPSVDPQITADLQALFDGAASAKLADFLASVRASGVDVPDADVALYCIEHLAAGAAATVGATALGGALADASTLINKLRAALAGSPN